MTINIETMRAMVERMGPDQLRQFARMHSNDAIAMSLVSSRLTELNRAKASQQAQQAPAQPPKVVEQVEQSIPMEESGIAALPVQNLAMADGGIVGYADGGNAEEETTFPEGSLLGLWEKYQKQNPGLPLAAIFSNAPEYQAMREEAQKQKLSGGPTGSIFVPGSQSGLRPEVPPEKPRAGLAALKQAPQTAKVTPKTPPTQAPSPTPTESAPTTQSVIDQYKAMQAAIGEPGYGDVTKAQTAANELSKKAAEENKAAVEKYWAERGDQFKGKEGRLTEREAALEKTKSNLEGMAWIQAGLETMSTSGSLGQAIAAGGKKGLSTYASGIDQYNAAKEKLDEARDKIDELRANQKDMSAKEIMAANRDINTVVAQNQQNMVAILREQAKNGDQKAADLLRIYDEQMRRKLESDIKRAEIASREKEGAADRASREKVAGMNIAALSERAILPKPITLDQAADNVSKFLESMQGMSYITQMQKAAKEAGKPVPDVYAIRKELIAKEMAGPAAAPPQASTRIKFDAQGNPI